MHIQIIKNLTFVIKLKYNIVINAFPEYATEGLTTVRQRSLTS